MALEHAQNGEVVHLRSLRDGDGSRALVKTEQFEAIHLIVPAGSTIPTHQVPGQATLLCLHGRVSLALAETEVILATGDWVYLDRAEEHAVRGLEDAGLLLTILFD